MYSFLKSKQIILLICLLALSASYQSAQAKSAHKSRQSRQYLVPPPPPYVPSMLPELTYSRGIYGQGYDSTSQAPSPKTYSPNKYVTYYYPNKG